MPWMRQEKVSRMLAVLRGSRPKRSEISLAMLPVLIMAMVLLAVHISAMQTSAYQLHKSSGKQCDYDKVAHCGYSPAQGCQPAGPGQGRHLSGSGSKGFVGPGNKLGSGCPGSGTELLGQEAAAAEAHYGVRYDAGKQDYAHVS